MSRSEKIFLIREQTHDRLTLGNALNGFGNQRGHGELADFLALQSRKAQRNGMVTTTSSSALPLAMRSMAGPEKMGWVQ